MYKWIVIACVAGYVLAGLATFEIAYKVGEKIERVYQQNLIDKGNRN